MKEFIKAANPYRDLCKTGRKIHDDHGKWCYIRLENQKYRGII